MTKKEMRKKMLSLRDSLSEKERMEKSREIAKRLFTLEEFQKAEVVLSYQSFRSEVETTEMNQKIRESGKSLYLPKTYADRKEMAFYRVYSDTGLSGDFRAAGKRAFYRKTCVIETGESSDVDAGGCL